MIRVTASARRAERFSRIHRVMLSATTTTTTVTTTTVTRAPACARAGRSAFATGAALRPQGRRRLDAALFSGRRRDATTTYAGKKSARKNAKGGGGAKPAGGGGGGGGGGGAGKYKSPGEVKEGSAYQTETRKIILSMSKVRKVTPNGKELIKNINLGMYLGAKIGILGANGAGKSTLMKILAGVDTAFDGEVYLEPGIKVGYLAQEPALDDGETVAENIAVGVKAVQDDLDEYNRIAADMTQPDADVDALMKRMDQLQNKLDASNAWELERTVARAMDALRCPPGDALVKNLSGGERRRVAICRLLLSQPDILLLDEPTNHLDAQSVAWLEQFLATFKGTVVAITHDRYFLDNVAGWILELDRGEGIPFEGNYSSWLESKSKRLDAEKKKKSSLDRQIEQELEWVRSNAKGQVKKGKARLRQYEELCEAAAQFQARQDLDSITIPAAPRLGDVVINASGLQKGYPGRGLLIDNLNCIIPPGSVVGIVGGNGAGKTTFFRMVTGEEKPDSGDIAVGETVKLMYVDQSRDSLDPEKTVYDTLSGGGEEITLGTRQVNARAYCSWYNFKSADQQKKVGSLSGGERNRLQLARTLTSGGNCLLLDEPTNDLDVATLRCLEDAIQSWNGTTICISHDRWFLNKIATHILAYEGDSNVVFFEGSYDEYEAHRLERMGGEEPKPLKFRPMPV